jgi:predicted DNA-binding protein with PD1-like motif
VKLLHLQNIIIVRLDEGEEVVSTLKKALATEGVQSGVISSFVGALRDCNLILRKGLERTIPDHVEAVGSGNISLYEGQLFIHLHLSIGNDKGTWVGHLNKGFVDVFCEAAVIPVEPRLFRSFDRGLADGGVTVPYVLDFR